MKSICIFIEEYERKLYQTFLAYFPVPRANEKYSQPQISITKKTRSRRNLRNPKIKREVKKRSFSFE